MTNRKNKIGLLKETLNNLQNHLKDIDPATSRHSLDKSSSLYRSLMSSRNRDTPKQNLNQTARYQQPEHPPIREQLYQQRAKHPLNRKNHKQNTINTLSPGLKDLITHVDSTYYQKKPQDDPNTSIHHQPPPQQQSFIGRRYQHTPYAECVTTHRQPSRKMFHHKKTDLIVNPEQPQHHTGVKKIPMHTVKSPDQMLTENPKSNPNLFFYNDRTILIQNRACLKSKNKSSLTFSPSVGQLTLLKSAQSLQKARQTQKKHFPKYVEQNYKSKILQP